MVAMLADKAAWDKCHADAGSKLVVVGALAHAAARCSPPPSNRRSFCCTDFTATWCGPCQRVAPAFAKMADDYPDAVFVKVDVDENSEVAELCGISAMPTFQFYKGGKKVDEFSGADSEKLKAMVEKNK